MEEFFFNLSFTGFIFDPIFVGFLYKVKKKYSTIGKLEILYEKNKSIKLKQYRYVI